MCKNVFCSRKVCICQNKAVSLQTEAEEFRGEIEKVHYIFRGKIVNSHFKFRGEIVFYAKKFAQFVYFQGIETA